MQINTIITDIIITLKVQLFDLFSDSVVLTEKVLSSSVGAFVFHSDGSINSEVVLGSVISSAHNADVSSSAQFSTIGTGCVLISFGGSV